MKPRHQRLHKKVRTPEDEVHAARRAAAMAERRRAALPLLRLREVTQDDGSLVPGVLEVTWSQWSADMPVGDQVVARVPELLPAPGDPPVLMSLGGWWAREFFFNQPSDRLAMVAREEDGALSARIYGWNVGRHSG